ncbi:Rne/Rng family ribonuclease [Rarobacter incanus]|uniref:Ribonuclease E n=1 Tax=Rarobacter incanus TaxID=153494 RepID=A0A542SN29_9MICO|nr:Rne/Rng family ribonuclease [Rarobacter incanus]TQK76033.1 ribonuclease E [Rarobacter incanus]
MNNDEFTPTPNAATPEGERGSGNATEAAPARKTRRRVTRPAGSKKAPEAAGAASAARQDAVEPQAATRPADDRTGRKSQRSAEAEGGGTDGAGADGSGAQSAQNPAAADPGKPTLDVFAELEGVTKRRASKRAPKKAVREQAEEQDGPGASADQDGAGASVDHEAAAEKPSRKRRGARAPKAAQAGAAAEGDQHSAVASLIEADLDSLSRALHPGDEADEAKDAPIADADAPKEEGAPRAKAQRRQTRGKKKPPAAPLFSAADTADETEEEESPADQPIRLAATTLLFQAPDVSPRARRRKATPEPLAEEPSEDAAAEDLVADSGAHVSPADEEQHVDAAGGSDADDVDDSDDSDDDGDDDAGARKRRRRRGGRGRRKTNSNADADAEESAADAPEQGDGEAAADAGDDGDKDDDADSSSRRRRRRRRGARGNDAEADSGSGRSLNDQVTALKGSTRLEAKRQRRREGRDAGRRRQIITEAEFLARRESVDRTMVVREKDGRTQIAVLEDGVLVEHYVSQQSQASMAGNVYLGRVQNVLPSMEAAFVDIGKGRNAVLYAGEVNWDAAGLADGQPRRIEQALKSGDTVVVQVTKDPIGHKGARLTSQVTLAGRYLVFVPGGGMTGISRKLPDTERSRLKRILRAVVPDGAGVIVRTAAEGASEEELTADIARLQSQWESIEKKSKTASAPSLLQGEPDMAIRVVRDIFNDDFKELIVSGKGVYKELTSYIHELAPDLESKMTKWVNPTDVFAQHRIDEQLAKGMDRKVWLPSGGSLVIDRTEAMTVIDVNTGKFTGTGGTLEETVTRNNLEAAEEIVRQLRLRDIGGIVVVDFIDMVLESNRDLVLRRLVECLGRDRTRHQVAEVTSLGLVQMTRKRVGQGLVEAFSETCSHCLGRGFIVHTEPNEHSKSHGSQAADEEPVPKKSSRRRKSSGHQESGTAAPVPVLPGSSTKEREAVKATLAQIAAAAAHAHDEQHGDGEVAEGEIVEPAAIEAVVIEAEVVAENDSPDADGTDSPAAP